MFLRPFYTSILLIEKLKKRERLTVSPKNNKPAMAQVGAPLRLKKLECLLNMQKYTIVKISSILQC